MKSFLKLSLATLLSLPLISHAALFNFSYLFQAGYGDDRGIEPTLIKGSFNGTQDGLFVKDISNIKVNIQGRDFTGPLISLLPVPENPLSAPEGQFSFDAALNNFWIMDSEVLTTGNSINYFLWRNYGNGDTLRQASNDTAGYSYGIDEDSSTNTSWRLTLVPEPAGWLLMAGSLAFLARRRRIQK